MAFNRLLGFRVVKSTRPVQYAPVTFIPPDDHRTPREQSHLNAHPGYPDPKYHLNYTQQYLFRHPDLRHLRVEQFGRFCRFLLNNVKDAETLENTISDDSDDEFKPDPTHRNSDSVMNSTAAGNRWASISKGLPPTKRRENARLGITRVPFIEPLGDRRELFYEAKLLLALAWYCDAPPEDDEMATTRPRRIGGHEARTDNVDLKQKQRRVLGSALREIRSRVL